MPGIYYVVHEGLTVYKYDLSDLTYDTITLNGVSATDPNIVLLDEDLLVTERGSTFGSSDNALARIDPDAFTVTDRASMSGAFVDDFVQVGTDLIVARRKSAGVGSTAENILTRLPLSTFSITTEQTVLAWGADLNPGLMRYFDGSVWLGRWPVPFAGMTFRRFDPADFSLDATISLGYNSASGRYISGDIAAGAYFYASLSFHDRFIRIDPDTNTIPDDFSLATEVPATGTSTNRFMSSLSTDGTYIWGAQPEGLGYFVKFDTSTDSFTAIVLPNTSTYKSEHTSYYDDVVYVQAVVSGARRLLTYDASSNALIDNQAINVSGPFVVWEEPTPPVTTTGIFVGAVVF